MSDHLKLINLQSVVEILGLEEIDHLAFVSTFQIPATDHNLIGNLTTIKSIAIVLNIYDKDYFGPYLDLTQALESNLEKNELVISHLISQEKGQISGLAANHPIYETIRKIPKRKNRVNIFEILLALLILTTIKKPELRPDPTAPSNIQSITRVIRKQFGPVFEKRASLQRIQIEYDKLNKSSIQESLKRYLSLIPPETEPALISLAEHYKSDNTVDITRPKDTSTQPGVKNPSTETIKLLSGLVRNSNPSPNVIKPRPIEDQGLINETGSLQEDNAESESLVLPGSIENEALSPQGAKAAAKAVQMKGVMQAQFSKHRWERLSLFEKEQVLSKIGESDAIDSLSALISLAFGCEPLHWGTFKFGDDEPDKSARINLKAGTWSHKVEPPLTSWQPSLEQVELIMPVSDVVSLSIPQAIIQRLNKFDIQDGQTLSDIFEASALELDESLKNWLLDINLRNREITVARLREELYSEVMDQTMDEVAAHMICAQPTFLQPIQYFYTAFTHKQLNYLYNNAINRILNSNERLPELSNQKVGSRLQVKQPVLSNFVTDMQNSLKKYDRENFISYHNRFALYTYQLLCFATGHRQVVDPFSKRTDFITSANAVIVYDKETDINHTGRACILGSIAAKQFELYCEHLQKLSSLIYDYDKLLRSAILDCLDGRTTLPFLFLLEWKDGQLNAQNISTTTLEKHLNSWRLPFNTHRHFLATKLRELNVSAEIIDYQLGHFQNGTLPMGLASNLSLKKIQNYLSPYIDQLLTAIGFKSIESGIKANLNTKKRSKVPTRKLGYQLRNERRKQKNKLLIKAVIGSVDSLISKAIELPNKDDEGIFQENIGRLIEVSLQDLLKHKDVTNRSKATVLFQSRLHKLLKKNKLKVNLSSPAKKFQLDPSPFTPYTGHEFHSFTEIRKKFRTYLNSSTQLTSSAVSLIAHVTLIEVIFGRLHNLRWIEPLIQNFASNFHMEDSQAILRLNYRADTLGSLKYPCTPLGSLILIKNRHLLEKLNDETDTKVTLEQMNLILKSIVPGIFGSTPLKTLFSLAKSVDAIELPGTLRAICTGEVQNFSLPQDRDMAIKNEHAINGGDDNSSQSSKPDLDLTASFSPGKNATFRKTKSLMSEVRQLFLDKKETKQNASQKKRLTNKIEETLAQKEHIYPIYSYLLQWCLYLLNDHERRNYRRAKVINKIVHSNANGLIEAFQSDDPLTYEESDFISAYNQVIQYYPSYEEATPEVIRHLTALQDFHEFLIEQFGVAEVDFTELDLPESISSYLVSANFISYKEYKVILNSLQNDEGVNVINRLFQAAAFCLTYNAGLRSNEVFSLAIKDLQAFESDFEKINLTIQPNRYEILKTKASKRNLPISIWLDIQEKAVLKNLFNLRIAQGAKPDAPLFAEFDNRYVTDIEVIKSRIVYAMRYTTGDSKLRFHHLRHSFATWGASSLLCTTENEHLKNPKERALRAHFSFSLTRRPLFQLAELMGHSHPVTTIVNYIHNFDTLLKNLHQSDQTYAADYPFLQHITGFGYDQLRQWKSRYCKTQSLTDFCISKLNTDIENTNISKPPYRLTLPVTTMSTKMPISFRHLKWLISRLAVIQKDEYAARALDIEPDKIELFKKSLTNVVTRSGYIPDCLVDFLSKKFGDKPNQDLFSKSLAIPNQLIDHEWVENLERFALNQEKMSEETLNALGLWISYVQPQESHWRFEIIEQLETFLSWLLKTGLKQDDLMLKGFEQPNLGETAFSNLQFKAIDKNQKFREPRKYLAFNPEKFDTALVALKEEHSSVRTMNFYLFILAAWYMTFNNHNKPVN